ncbi:MAG: hypothetical protein JNL54_13885 [Kineosporiaceae bacterium]|nr:hypothetical protein [Kineosporiaceae bacterium]
MRPRADERGQTAAWLTLVVAGGLLALGVTSFSRLARAEDQAGSIQTSADAAALAGAQLIGKEAPVHLVELLESHRLWPECGWGQGAADDFAARNGSDVVSYCFYPGSGRVEVTVRSRAVAESGRREQATAFARLGVRLGPCLMPTLPTPTPTPPGGPPPGPTPTPPDVEDEAHCGDVTIPVTIPGDGSDPVFHWDAAHFAGLFEPRLTD